MRTWVDGCSTDRLPLPDRGIEFGDGLFETMPIIDGRIPWLSLHLQRLRAGLHRLDFPPATADTVHSQLVGALEDACSAGIMRLTVTRGSAPRGYAPPLEPKPRVIIQMGISDGVGQPVLPPANVACSAVRWSWQPALAGIKHNNRLEQVLAARERQRADVDEMLMLDQSDNVISVISANLFVLRGESLLTPSLEHCGIAGTRRRLLLDELAPVLGLTTQEVTLTESEIIAADAVFYCNSVRGYQPIGRYGTHRWAAHPSIDSLQALYAERLRICDA